MHKLLKIGFWEFYLVDRRNNFLPSYVHCQHTLMRDLAVLFLNGNKIKDGYKFIEPEIANYFAWLFQVPKKNVFEVPF
jgi:hypothetical protein